MQDSAPPTPATLLPLPTHLPRWDHAGLLSLQTEAFFLSSLLSFPPCLSWLLRGGVPPSEADEEKNTWPSLVLHISF